MLAVLRIRLHLKGNANDPYLLYRVRDGFQGAFRRVVGCADGECSRCDRNDECPYSIVFGQELSLDPAAVKRHQKPPLPFAFSFPVFPGAPNAGLDFDIRLTLVGNATRFVAEIVAAVNLLFARKTEQDELAADIVRVESLGYHAEATLVYEGSGSTVIADSLTLLSTEGLGDTFLLNNDGRMHLRLVTPLKIMQEGRPLRDFSFSLFMRTLIRRISSLTSYYCDDGVSVDFRWLASLCDSVTLSDRSISWVAWGGGKQGGKLAGLLGEVVLVGVPEEFLSFLLLGELLNVGKGAAFGLGRFTLEHAGE